MTVAQSAADVLSEHVEFDLECIDRMYLNVYVPILQAERGIAFYWQSFRGYKFASSALMKEKTDAFINSISQFIEAEDIPVVRFTKGIRKDDVAKEYLANFKGREGVLFVGKAQEKAKVVRTERRRNPATGATYPWLVRTTSVVNQYYFYCIDEDFGPFFIKFCSYFPYNAKLCINGHEYLKRQLAKRGLKFEALDNGILSCEDPKRMQRLADGLTPKKIDDLLRKWFRKLPHPFSAADRRARFLYDVSILQAEFALTQVLDRPLSGRVFFEQMIRENIDLGRPDQVQLIFDRRIVKNTPGRFRTRVLTDGVIPSLHIDYKSSRIKQYHKKGRALRTETVINNTYDFRVPRKLKNLPQLREVGLSANRRLLDVQRLSFDATIGEDAFNDIARPVRRECGPPVAALRFGDPRVMALFAGLVVFGLLPWVSRTATSENTSHLCWASTSAK
jgi:hypothetical protein